MRTVPAALAPRPFTSAAVVLAACVVAGWTLLVEADMFTGRHNLAARTTGATGSAVAEQAVCIFCHTPQGVPAGADARPTWVPSHMRDLEFRVFDPLDPGSWPGLADPTETIIGFQSFVCLTCHDGTQAELAGGRPALDHPIGVPYRGTDDAAFLIRDHPDRSPPDDMFREYRVTTSAMLGGNRVWWISTTGRLTRSKNDLPLYTRADPASGTTVPFIECATCHDPHSANARFLRVAETSSGLCMSCHIK